MQFCDTFTLHKARSFGFRTGFIEDASHNLRESWMPWASVMAESLLFTICSSVPTFSDKEATWELVESTSLFAVSSALQSCIAVRDDSISEFLYSDWDEWQVKAVETWTRITYIKIKLKIPVRVIRNGDTWEVKITLFFVAK